ncbi:EAL domain-containing response regulator [Shewanella sedimentimangrovi]|uniref:EAL domain-containing response regulator n=1 Tax=Shewanella sedimentimangrovi TaxID=2814293 RepID=A0ABX7R000_9GAMM|nr:EAL domain-containing response regulator [Shewanella sedimentimangrovi]QSX36420.1 EAL domain-containing response regulator [Shewanella sedimentimangrovi]
MTLNVLIIDDSLSTCQLLSRYFSELDVDQVEYCRDGLAALRLLTKYRDHYHILVVDLHMPGMDGIELLSRLSRIGFRGGVIIASGMESRIIEAASQVVINSRLRLLGALTKPVCQTQLQICIERLMMMAPDLGRPTSRLSAEQIRQAIQDDKVVPYYQAQVDSKGRIEGFEVLCRLQDGDHLQLVGPDAFIDMAEQHGLLNAISEKLINCAMREWLEIGRHPECQHSRLSINLTPKQLASNGWPAKLLEYCDTYELDISRLTVEITENQALDQHSQHASISRLRLHSVGVAIDDFGTGYTNLTQLCRLPISELKLDMSLVRGIHMDALAQTILKSLVEIGARLGVAVVAEGVEDPRDYTYLEQYPNIIIQGFLICRPKPCQEIMRWLDAHQKVVHLHAQPQPGMLH